MKRILLVDDEIQILQTLSRMLLEAGYEVYTAENSMDALTLLESTKIDMIISDLRMPVMDGYKLLNIVKEKYPHIIRIIISGYAEEQSMFKALLHNVAKLYVFKPWNDSDFLLNINKLFEEDSIIHSQDLLAMIEDMGCSSQLPSNCEKMITLVENEDLDALIEAIEHDPDISELLMQVAKSSIYGVMPDNIKQASKYIGLHNLKCFLRWACVASHTKQTDSIERHPELLWKHSYLTNRILLFFYEAFLHKQPPASTMFAGLLHNIGLIILSKSLQKNGSLKQPNLSANDYITLENGEYELSHQEIGAHFLDIWDLPFPIYEVALYHHRPSDTGIVNKELVSAVHIAQAYAWKVLAGNDEARVKKEAFENLNVTTEEFERRLSRYLK